MSWDLTIFRAPEGIEKLDDIPPDYQPPSLGKKNHLIQQIVALLPDVDFSDPSWGHLHRDNCVIEFNMGSEDRLTGFGLRVRGDDEVIDIIADLLNSLRLTAVDLQDTELFDPKRSRRSLAEWRAHRDRAVSGSQENGPVEG